MIERIRRYVSRGLRMPSVVHSLSRKVADVKSVLTEQRHDDGRVLGALEDITARLEVLESTSAAHARTSSESLWAEVFHDTIASSRWLVDKALSPGRWAVGYPYLYVLYRVLDEARPMRILELGLGQSTKVISQYAAADARVHHIVVEHDERWTEFFSRHFGLPCVTQVLRCEWGNESYDGVEGVRIYSGLAERIRGQRFDLISIDGPLGGDMTEYARIDVLRMMPDILSDSFAIMIDDCERPGEARTSRAMCEALTLAGVDFKRGNYRGDKDVAVICSLDWAFLCSM